MNPHLSRFGLEREPFSNAVDESFFLLDSDRAQRLNMLYHLVQNSEALLLLTGIEGSGKTSLLQKFLAMGNDTWRYCLIRANAMMNPEQLLRHIAEGFGLEPDSINFNTALETLKSRFIELRRSGLTALLLVDDAHELPAASLTVIMKLSELRDEDEGLVRTVLFSEPQIRDMLSAPELSDVRHRITHTLEMPSLNEQQTSDYIDYRLSVAGLEGKSPFSRSKMKKIHKLSHGIPALINEHANAMLHGGDMPDTGTKGPSTSVLARLRASAAIIGLLVVAGLATYFVMQDTFEEFFSGDATQTVTQLDLSEPKKPVEAKPQDAIEPQTPLDEDSDSTPAAPPAGEPVASVVPASPETPETPETAAPARVNKYAVDHSGAVKAPGGKADTDRPADKPAGVEPEPRPPVKPVLRDSSKTPAPRADAAPEKDTASPAAAKPAGDNWLATQDKNHFTLQLMGSRSQASVEGFRRSNKLGDQAAVIKTLHQGSEWFVLVYGSYPDKEQARAAISRLPAGLRKAKPWPRKIGDLKP